MTLTRLWEGSPMPIKTTFFVSGLNFLASNTCEIISKSVNCRMSPERPVIQKTQPTAHPTWEDTQTPSRGKSTVSIVWPSWRAKTNLTERVPSSRSITAGWTAESNASLVCTKMPRTALGNRSSSTLGQGTMPQAARMINAICESLAPSDFNRSIMLFSVIVNGESSMRSINERK